MKVIHMVLLILLAGLRVLAQEDVFALADKQVYITGEKIWVSGKITGQKQEPVIQVLLLNREGRMMARERTRVSGSCFYASLQLKGDLKSDNYLVCFQVGDRLTRFIPLMIINPVIPPSLAPTPQLNQPLEEQTLHVSTSATVYAARQTIELRADSTGPERHYFLSVFREDALARYADSLFAGWSMKDLVAVKVSEGISGRLSDASGQPVPNALVTAAVLSDQAELSYGISGPDGHVFIPLPYHYTDLPVAVQARDTKGLRFARTEPVDQFQLLASLPALVLSSRFGDDISERLLHAELGNKLKDGPGERLVLDEVDTLDIYGKPDKRYILDNYVRFPDMREVIAEFIPDVRIRKLNGQTALQVTNTPYKVFFDQPAMVLVDGVPVTDIDQLLAMDPLRFRSIDVVARKFLLGTMQIPGIIHYKTYKTDLGGYTLPPDVLLVDHKGLQIPSEPLFRIPDEPSLPYFRDLLYWQPPSRHPSFRFPASDAPGLYRVQLFAVDNNGKTFAGTTQITVK